MGEGELQIELEEACCPTCNVSECTQILTAYSMDNLASQPFSIIRCKQCDLMFTSPRPTSSSMKSFYEGGFYETQEKAVKRLLVNPVMVVFQRLRLRQVTRVKKTGKLLDIGSGKGKFLAMAAHNKWEAWGVEPSNRSRSFVKDKSGEKVFGDEFEEAAIPDGFFDIVTMWHTLEHFYDPLDILAKVHAKLNERGLLVVRVPNSDSWDFKLGKANWFHLDLPRHLYHFSPKSLSTMLEKAGFQVVSVSTFSLEDNPIGILQTFMTLLGFKTGSIFSLLKESSDAGKLRKISGSLLIIFVVTVLLLPSLVFSGLSSAVRQGGTLTILAKKNGSPSLD